MWVIALFIEQAVLVLLVRQKRCVARTSTILRNVWLFNVELRINHTLFVISKIAFTWASSHFRRSFPIFRSCGEFKICHQYDIYYLYTFYLSISRVGTYCTCKKGFLITVDLFFKFDEIRKRKIVNHNWLWSNSYWFCFGNSLL